MKTQHTPGTWIASTTYHKGNPDGACVLSGSRRVANCEDGLSQEECEANARLIAAAPELLETLKHLTKEINLNILNIRKDFSLINAHTCAIKAIAKATGTP